MMEQEEYFGNPTEAMPKRTLNDPDRPVAIW